MLVDNVCWFYQSIHCCRIVVSFQVSVLSLCLSYLQSKAEMKVCQNLSFELIKETGMLWQGWEVRRNFAFSPTEQTIVLRLLGPQQNQKPFSPNSIQENEDFFLLSPVSRQERELSHSILLFEKILQEFLRMKCIVSFFWHRTLLCNNLFIGQNILCKLHPHIITREWLILTLFIQICLEGGNSSCWWSTERLSRTIVYKALSESRVS